MLKFHDRRLERLAVKPQIGSDAILLHLRVDDVRLCLDRWLHLDRRVPQALGLILAPTGVAKLGARNDRALHAATMLRSSRCSLIKLIMMSRVLQQFAIFAKGYAIRYTC